MSRFAIVATAMIGLSAATPAFASDLEKVDIVKEGIDQKQIVVRAAGNGYTSYRSDAHRYHMRVYAKAKGSSAVWFVGVNPKRGSADGKYSWLYSNKARSSDGWSQYSKSISVDLRPEHTQFFFNPITVCTENMRAQVKKGMPRVKVLEREWKLVAQARFSLTAAADSKRHNRKNDHGKSGNTGFRDLIYPVNVLCEKAG